MYNYNENKTIFIAFTLESSVVGCLFATTIRFNI